MANCCVASGIRLRLHTEVCSLQTSPSAPCTSSILPSQSKIASNLAILLPFATVSIDIDRAKAIPMDAVYSEAKTLLNNGFRYWFNDEEIIELHRNSEAFQVYTTEMELLLRYFTFPSEAEMATKRFYMTNSEIVGYLSCYTRQPLSPKRMGEALRRAGYTRECRRINGNPVYVYAVRKIYPEQPP